MCNSGRMQGKRTLVTGAGTGIGKGIAIEYAKEGAVVALHCSSSTAPAQEVKQQILDMGGKAEVFQADFNKVEEVKKLAVDAVDFLGGLDVLVNNAGITMNLPFEKVSPEQFNTLYNVNIRAQFFLTQAVLPTMVAQKKGVIINLTSNHAFSGLREHSVYAGTKGAIVSYSRELAVELAPKGIRVNALAPGWVCVENQKQLLGKDFDWAGAAAGTPAGFIAEPPDMGRIAVFLASDDSRYILGQTIIADGGQGSVMPGTGDFRAPFSSQFGTGYVTGVEDFKESREKMVEDFNKNETNKNKGLL